MRVQEYRVNLGNNTDQETFNRNSEPAEENENYFVGNFLQLLIKFKKL